MPDCKRWDPSECARSGESERHASVKGANRSLDDPGTVLQSRNMLTKVVSTKQGNKILHVTSNLFFSRHIFAPS